MEETYPMVPLFHFCCETGAVYWHTGYTTYLVLSNETE